MTPAERRAYQNERNATKRAAARAALPSARSGELTYVGNPAEGVYTVHRVTCYMLKDRANYIAGVLHWKARRHLCRECRPTMAEAAVLNVRFAEPPATSQCAAVVENEAGAKVTAEHRIKHAFRPTNYYGSTGVSVSHATLEQIMGYCDVWSPSAEDEYFAELEWNAERDAIYEVTCGRCNRPQTGGEWATGFCVCGAGLNWPRRTEHPELTLAELECA